MLNHNNIKRRIKESKSLTALNHKHSTRLRRFKKKNVEETPNKVGALSHGYRSTATVLGAFTAELRRSRAAIGPLPTAMGTQRF
jgi:hypothetical protein